MPPSKIWEERQEEIEALIRNHPLNYVIDEMGRRGFHASKFQYEDRIGKWRLRKNLKWTEWKTTFAIYDKLVSQKGSKNVRILLSGDELGPRKIYKRRLYTCQANGSSSRTTSGKRGRFHQPDTEYGLPLAVTIELRKADGTWVPASANELSCKESDGAPHDEVHADELEETYHASQHFSATYPPHDPAMLVEDIYETMHLAPMGTDRLAYSGVGQVWSTIDAVDGGVFLQGSTALDPVFAGLQTVGMARSLPLLDQDDLTPTDFAPQFVDYLQSCLRTPRFTMFEASLRQMGLDTKDIMASGCGHEMSQALQDSSSQFLLHVAPQTFPGTRQIGSLAYHPNWRDLIRPVLSVLPGEPHASESSRDQLNHILPRSILFSAANSFVGLEQIDISTVLRLMSRFKNTGSLITKVGGLADSYCKCLVTNLFKACIKAGQAGISKQLLALNLFDVNTIVCLCAGKKFTALELASKLRHLELVKTLLEFRADPNKSFQLGHWYAGALGALIISIRSESATATSLAIQDIARELLQADAMVNAKMINKVIDGLHAADLAQALMERLMKTSHDISILEAALTRYAGEVEEALVCKALDNLRTVYNRKGQMETGFDHPVSKEFQNAIVECAKKGYVQTVQKYADLVESRTMLLCGAFRSHQRDMMDLLLSEVMDVNTIVYIDPDYSYPSQDSRSRGSPTTPFAEAILTGDDHLIALCVDAHHALDSLHCDLQFRVAVDAAASIGNAGLVQRFLNPELHLRPRNLSSALLHAVERGYNGIAYLLLNAGAPSWDWDGDGPESRPGPLLTAILQGNIPMAKTILELGEAAWYAYRKPPGTGTTILAETIRLGDRDLMLLLRDCFPHTIALRDGLGAALAECDENTLQFLLKNEVIEKHQLTFGLRFAAEQGDLTMARKMLELGATLREDYSILSMAAATNPEILLLFIGQTPHFEASLLSYKNRVHVLQAFPWGTTNGLTSMKYALDSGLFNSHERYRLEYPAYKALWTDGYSILGLSILKSDVEAESGALTVQMLLNLEHDPNQVAGECSDGNKTPLLLAIEKKSKQLVEMLLDAGAEVNPPATWRLTRTPLQKAAELGCLDIVKLLLARGAEVNAGPAPRTGGTALQFAAISGNINIAHELLKNNADLHAEPKVLGRWPLEGAAEHGRADMVDYLWRVSCGGFNDTICKRAMHLALENGHEPVKELIEELMRHREMFPVGPW